MGMLHIRMAHKSFRRAAARSYTYCIYAGTFSDGESSSDLLLPLSGAHGPDELRLSGYVSGDTDERPVGAYGADVGKHRVVPVRRLDEDVAAAAR